MSNMSYCRFQNTLPDFLDCVEHMSDDELSDEEKDAREELIALCIKIAKDRGYVLEDEDAG